MSTEMLEAVQVEAVDQAVDQVQLDNNLDVRITKMHLQTVLDAMDRILQGRTLNKANVLRVTYALLSVTKKLKNGTARLPGNVKRDVLVGALRSRLVKDNDMSEEDREFILLIANDACRVLIEAINSTSKCCVVQ